MQAPPMEAERRRPQRRRRRPSAAGGRLEKLHLDCASSAHSHYGNTQQWPLLHRKDCLQGSEIPAVILSPSRLVPIIAASPAREPMATARLGQMVTLRPPASRCQCRLAEQLETITRPGCQSRSHGTRVFELPTAQAVIDSDAAARVMIGCPVDCQCRISGPPTRLPQRTVARRLLEPDRPSQAGSVSEQCELELWLT
jgi:hypothetical protein